jgi:hypothetical protein
MNRREMLGLMAGTLVIPGDLLSVGRTIHQKLRSSAYRVFNAQQRETVGIIAELIIPETDTPGARAARVPEFIDFMLAETAEAEDRQRFLSGLNGVNDRSRSLFAKDFAACDKTQQIQILTALDSEVARLRDVNGEVGKHFFYNMKRLTVVGYYTSEVGATAEQHYQVIPGRYEPCYPLAQ